LVDYCSVSETSKDARDYFTTQSASEGLSAMAILIDSPVGKMLGSFFIAIYKTSYPVRIFTKKDKALNWLKKAP
jgi:hypothetical protein